VDLVFALAVVETSVHARCQHALLEVRVGAENGERMVFAGHGGGSAEELTRLANDEGVAFLKGERNGGEGYRLGSGGGESVFRHRYFRELVDERERARTKTAKGGESKGDERRSLRHAEIVVLLALTLLRSVDHS
jgi:hypothetical protein